MDRRQLDGKWGDGIKGHVDGDRIFPAVLDGYQCRVFNTLAVCFLPCLNGFVGLVNNAELGHIAYRSIKSKKWDFRTDDPICIFVWFISQLHIMAAIGCKTAPLDTLKRL